MEKIFKVILFSVIFIIIYISLSYLFLSNANLRKYGMYNIAMYEILGEKEKTIDTIVLGDSLVYSSVSPMYIYDKYGYTVFDCSEPAQILSDAYDYFKIAVDSQNPKVVIIEPNIFFRDANKRPWYNKPLKVLKNSLPLVTYHNNWKQIFFSNQEFNNWINVSKGYKKNINIKASYNYDYMQKIKIERKFPFDTYIKKTQIKNKIPYSNFEYIEKIINYCDERNIKILLVGLPSQKSWNYEKHKVIEKLSKKRNLDYINLNFDNVISIDWENDTKDNGGHLNDFGAKKVSEYVGNYLKKLNVVHNHKNEIGYEEWDKACKYYLNH